jgi:uncharacterized protein YjbJ (UPF0337 family)
MSKNSKTLIKLIKKIDKNLKKNKLKLNKKIHSLSGGSATGEQEKEEDKLKKNEIENLNNASEQKLDGLLEKRIKKDIEKAERIETLFSAIDSIIEDPSSADEQMNTLLGASMNIDPQKIKEAAVAVYAVLETVDTEEILKDAKEIASTASQAMKALPLEGGPGSDAAAQVMSVGKDLANDPNVQNAVGEVKNAMGDLKNTVNDAKQALGDVKTIVGDAKEALGSVKAVVGDAKAIGAELLKSIPPEQTAAAAAAASTAASAISKLAENIDLNAMANTLATVASALEPIMEIGAAIPGLGVCLALVNKLAKQYRESKELKEILEDMQDGIQNSLLLIKLIKSTMSIYQIDSASYYSAQTKLLAGKLSNAKNDKDKKNLEKAIKLLFKEAGYLSKIQLKPNIEAKVTSKVQNMIEVLKRLLPEAAPQTNDPKRGLIGRSIDFVKRQASKVSAFYNRFGMAAFYKAQILKDLNIVNNLLIIYNSQFDWAQSSFIMRIKNKEIKDQKLLDLIWTRVESSDDFKNYLWHDDGPGTQQGGKTRKVLRRTMNKNGRKTMRCI